MVGVIIMFMCGLPLKSDEFELLVSSSRHVLEIQSSQVVGAKRNHLECHCTQSVAKLGQRQSFQKKILLNE